MDPDDIALGAAEDLPDDGEELLVGRRFLWSPLPLPPDHTPDRVSGELKELADLPDLNSLLIKTQNGLSGLLGDHRHRNHTS